MTRRPSVPRTATDLVWALDDMRAALGPPEAMADPHARARYYLDCDLLVATTRNRQET